MEQPFTRIQRRAFMQLPLKERRRLLAEQADRIAVHYEENKEWREMEAGDFIDDWDHPLPDRAR